MFIPLIYGQERASIDTGEFLIKCPSCESDQWAEVLVTSVYSHLYYIPLYPNDKDAYVCCEKCGSKRYEVPFDAKLIKNYDEIKGKYRHPWHTYTGVGIIALPFVIWFIVSVVSYFQV